jgi:diguanylate cyclase (GGDEF)-like protein
MEGWLKNEEWKMDIRKYLDRRSRSFMMLSALAMAALICWMNLKVIRGVSLAVFYLIPVAITAWYVRLRSAILLSVAAAIAASSVNQMAWSFLSQLIYLAAFAVLLDQLKKTMLRKEKLVKVDPLTGVSNRSAFYDYASSEISRNRRYKRPFTVAYMDIDNLKMINYKFGHGTGDALLSLVAQTIKNNIRDVDIISRFGGDEFAMLFPETGAESAQVVLSRLKGKLLENVRSKDWPVTFSFGATTFIKPPDSVEDMVKRAGVQMYAAKDIGANMTDQNIFGAEDEK